MDDYLRCKHCDEVIEARKCRRCRKLLKNECQECHDEIAHSKIGPMPRGRSRK